MCFETQLFLHQTLALGCASTSAFAPQPSAFVSKGLSASTPVIDNLGKNLAVKNLLLNVEFSAGLLIKAAIFTILALAISIPVPVIGAAGLALAAAAFVAVGIISKRE